MKKYSPSTHMFYVDEFWEAYNNIPDDLVDIEDEVFNNIMKDKPLGSVLYHDKDMNIFISEPPPSEEHTYDYDINQWYLDASKVEAKRKASIPTSVTMRQARLALLGIDKLKLVQTAINTLDEPTKSAATIEWEYSSAVNRNSVFVEVLGKLLGLNSDEIDNLFIAASKL